MNSKLRTKLPLFSGMMHLISASRPSTAASTTRMQSGNISDYPLSELIREINTRQLSGALRLERERAKVVAYFERGEPIFAAANIRELRLGEYLVKYGKIRALQLSDYPKNLSDTALANSLTTNGILPAVVIQESFAKLTFDTLRVASLWPDGTWQFDNLARLDDSTRVKINVRNLLVESARKMSLQLVAARFPDPTEPISPHADVSTIVDLNPNEAFVLSRLDQTMSLDQLVTLSGLGELEASRTIYSLALAGHIKRASWPEMLKLTRTAGPKVATLPELRKPSSIAGSLESEEEDSSGFLARIERAADHYGILDVQPAASTEEIKRAYYSLARRYHPDRFHSDSTLHSRIESAFSRITQAYEVLTDTSQRSNYDAKLAAQDKAMRIADAAPRAQARRAGDESSSTAEPGFAEKSFRDGYAALQMGQVNTALAHLAAAANAAPHEGRYRAYYGQALAANEKSQRMAEHELLTAIRLEPRNASYHVMLAQLYYDLTFSLRAQAEAERALQLDPEHPGAKELLRKLEKK